MSNEYEQPVEGAASPYQAGPMPTYPTIRIVRTSAVGMWPDIHPLIIRPFILQHRRPGRPRKVPALPQPSKPLGRPKGTTKLLTLANGCTEEELIPHLSFYLRHRWETSREEQRLYFGCELPEEKGPHYQWPRGIKPKNFNQLLYWCRRLKVDIEVYELKYIGNVVFHWEDIT